MNILQANNYELSFFNHNQNQHQWKHLINLKYEDTLLVKLHKKKNTLLVNSTIKIGSKGTVSRVARTWIIYDL